MCDIYQNDPVDIKFENAVRILDFMVNNGFLIAYFTGGEPALHPNIVEIINYADKHGLVTSMTTNGTIRPDILQNLSKVGLHTLSVSIDSWKPDVCEKMRGSKGIQEKVQKTIALATCDLVQIAW